MIDIARLETFIYAAEHLSFTEAARLLHLTQPTVSHHIKLLEQDLGVELFERAGSKLRLSEAGHLLLPWARKLLLDSIELREMMDSLQNGIAGHLRIACSTTAGKYLLPLLAARFSQKFQGVRVSILRCTSENAVPRLLAGEANLGVVSYETDDEDIELQEFFEDRIAFIVPANHPWVGRDMIQPADLLEESIIIREQTSGTRRVMLSELSKHDIGLDDLNVLMEIGNAEAIVKTVSAGYGVSFVSSLALSCALDLGNIATVEINGMKMRRQVYMIRKRLDTPSRSQDAFWSFVHSPENRNLIQMAT